MLRRATAASWPQSACAWQHSASPWATFSQHSPQSGAKPSATLLCVTSSLAFWHTRLFAASSDGAGKAPGGGGGPPKDRMRAIPFMVSRQAAEEAYKVHHQKNILLAPTVSWTKVKEVFLPFWMASARVQVHVRSAQVGHNRLVSRYNAATKRSEPRIETDWQTVTLNQHYTRSYHPEDPGCQVFASFKYPRPDIQALRPGPALAAATGLDPELFVSPISGSSSDTANEDMSSGGSGELRRVVPFAMPPAAARTFVISWINGNEHSLVEGELLKHYSADSVRLVDLHVSPLTFVVHPVLVPAFVFRLTYRGAKVHTFVSGTNAQNVSGVRLYDETKAAALAAVTVPLLLYVTGTVCAALPLFWLGAVLPALLATGAARYYPTLRQAWQRRASDRAEAQALGGAGGGAEGGGSLHGEGWEAEWVRQYLGREDARRRLEEDEEQAREEQQAHSSHGQAAGSVPGDPQGYYKVLSVGPDASTADIQAAFRAAALRDHPDRVVGEDNKRRASAKFVRINEAYSVLRDPAKRRRYDSGYY